MPDGGSLGLQKLGFGVRVSYVTFERGNGIEVAAFRYHNTTFEQDMFDCISRSTVYFLVYFVPIDPILTSK